MNEQVRQARHITWVGFWVNAALGVAKIIGGIVGRSSALIADGIHSFSDFVSDIIVLTMVRIARKHPDRGHQFGHGRYEALATILLGIILWIVAVGIFYEGIVQVIKVIHGELLPRPGIIALVIIVVSIVSKEWLFHATRAVGRRIHSEAVVANAWHHRSDSLSSLATLAGVGGAMLLGGRWCILDPLAAVIVAVFIVIVGWQMARPAMSELLGASLPDADQDKIRDVLRAYPEVLSWHALRTFKSGNDAYIEVHLKLCPDITVRQAHDIATGVERAIRAALPEMSVHPITHVEPAEGADDVCNLHR